VKWTARIFRRHDAASPLSPAEDPLRDGAFLFAGAPVEDGSGKGLARALPEAEAGP
jgi:hypothetical protein